MSSKLMSSVTSGLKLKKKSVQQAPVYTPTIEVPVNLLQTIPEYDKLLTVPGIQPYLLPELIPDLIYLLDNGQLETAVLAANPDKPFSIIWNHPSQETHRETLKTELDILSGEIDVRETEIECINPKCRLKSVVKTTKQMRSPDEPSTDIFRCTKCRKIWLRSSA